MNVPQEEVLMLLAAQKFYIDHEGRTDKLDMFVRNWLTDELRQRHEPAYYVQKVRTYRSG